MPTVSEFRGILIRMYDDDHAPPHFHAMHGEFDLAITIDSLEPLEGSPPRRIRKLAMEWARAHQAELRENWQRARIQQPLYPIPPMVME